MEKEKSIGEIGGHFLLLSPSIYLIETTQANFDIKRNGSDFKWMLKYRRIEGLDNLIMFSNNLLIYL